MGSNDPLVRGDGTAAACPAVPHGRPAPAYGLWMDPVYGKVALLAFVVVMFVLRAPHVRRAARVRVVRVAGGWTDPTLVGLVGVGLLGLPVLWVSTPFLRAFDYPLCPAAFGAGILVHLLGLWLLWRSHVDLGPNWSNTLQVREQHALVTEGIYRRVRHPMYAALLLFGVGQALVGPNAVAGPAFLVTFALLVVYRLRAEERLMVDQFGAAYEAYRSHTSRLVPGLF